MRRTISVKLFAAAAGGLLLLTSGCTGPQQNKNQPGQAGNVVVDQSGSTQDRKQVGGCNTSDKKDPFALDPAKKTEPFDPLAENEKLPPAIQVDANRSRLLATRIGVGVQVYDQDSANSTWALREPQANLYGIETGVQHGIHFAGPYWTDTDGSRVKAKASGEAEAPIDSERNVKWLRLEAVEKFGSNNDVFSQVTFIQRVLTDGGQPPSKGEPVKGCDTLSVPYTALYVFWGPKEQ
ncbi:MAG: DUF3455 domain-containing protein [Pseudonocardiaceae bacterium]